MLFRKKNDYLCITEGKMIKNERIWNMEKRLFYHLI